MSHIKTLYDENSHNWKRSEKTSLSDYTGRDPLFNKLGILNGEKIADLGCGEGYCSRKFIELGAGEVVGVDISEEMVKLAQESFYNRDGQATFFCADVTNFVPDEMLDADIFVFVFLFNYLTLAESEHVLSYIRKHKKSSKPRLLATIPHPFLGYMNTKKFPFHFDMENENYFEAEDREFFGEIFTTKGTALPVRAVHKTFSSLVNMFINAGWKVESVEELTVTEELSDLETDFFGPLRNVPLHVLVDAHSD